MLYYTLGCSAQNLFYLHNCSMYRRLILLLAAITLVILWTSLAQEIGTGDWQTTTEVDTGVIVSSWLDFTGLPAITEGTDNLPLSEEINLRTGDTGAVFETGLGLLTWSLELSPQYHLIISEVYFDGTDEWIEITNIGDGNFQGNFTLAGVKSTTLSLTNISLLAGESKLFGDNFSQVSGNRFIGKTGLSLNLIDTNPINIQLSMSGQVEDSFLVDAYRVNLYNDKKTSFEKIGGISTRTTSGRIVNALSWYTINPWVHSVMENIPTDVSFPPTQSWGSIQLPISCVSVNQTDLIKVSEIFPGNESYPPYIELAINDDISLNSLSISGNLLGTGVTFSWNTWGTTLEKNSFLLISSTGFRNDEGIQSVRNDDFSLVSTWNWLLITIGSWQNGQVMDIVYHSWDMLGISIYFNTTTLQCARVLDSVDSFSPGFERRFLKYISGRTAPIIEYIYVSTGNQWTGNICPGSGTITPFSWENQVVTTGFVTWEYIISIVDVVYDPEGSDTDNETVTLLAHHISGDTTSLDLSKNFRLKVNGTNKTLPRTLPMNVSTTFIKTFGFPNSTKDGSEVIVQLTYGDHIFDTYRYNPNLPKEEELLTGEILSTWLVYDFSWVVFSITYVLPNPKGKDSTEEIWILITGHTSLTGIDISQGFTLRRGSTKKKLSGIVHGGQENILSWNLGLVNKAACISLFYQEMELTKFCYRTPKEGEKIYASNKVLEETSQENLDILTKLQLKKIGNKLCIWYQDESFLCKNIPAGKAAFKTTQEQKLYKWFSSLIKSYIISDRKPLYYDTEMKQYFDLLTENKKLIGKWRARVDIYGQRVAVTDIKQQLEVMEHTPLVIVTLFEGAKALLKD